MFLFEWTKFLTLKDMDVKTSYVKKSGQFIDDNKTINFSKNIILGGYNICKKYNYQQVCADLISESNFYRYINPLHLAMKATFCPKIEYLAKC